MVVRYAVSEKSVLDQKAGRQQAERKLQEATKEKDFLQQKLSGMVTEKARICQMLDNKVKRIHITFITYYTNVLLQCYELKGAQQELDRSKQDLTALETKLKWSQNSLRTEMELHKVRYFQQYNITLQRTVQCSSILTNNIIILFFIMKLYFN